MAAVDSALSTRHIQQYPARRRTNKPASNAPTPTAPAAPTQSPPPLEAQDTEPDFAVGYGHDGQPSPEELKTLGIKTRDFGYESKLPPVKPYMRPTVPDIAAPSNDARSLRRQREDDTAAIKHEESPPKKQKLSRTTGSQKFVQYPFWHIGHRQFPGGLPTSPQQQGNEPLTATPLATPNGSMNSPEGDSQPQEDEDMMEPSQSQATEPPDSQLQDFQLPDVSESQETIMLQPIEATIPASRSPTPRPSAAALSSAPSHSSPSIPTLARIPSPRYKLRPRSAAPPPTASATRQPRAARKKPASGRRDKTTQV